MTNPSPFPVAIRPIVLLSVLLCGATGCGWYFGTERYDIAALDGNRITRDDLEKLIHDMSHTERPLIQSRQDYLRVLNQYIDQEIKIPLGQELQEEGKIDIPREIARETYFRSIKNEEEKKAARLFWAMPAPKPGEESELMKVYELTAESFQYKKTVVDIATDRILEKMLGDEAVAFLAMEAYKSKELVLDDAVMRQEYEVTKHNYKTLERMSILGLQFPTAVTGSPAEAAQVRKRLDGGEDFDAILEEYLAKSVKYGMNSDIENNPAQERFRGFWQETSGASVGEIRGPVFMPEYARMRQDAQGQVTQSTVPECFLVFKVVEHEAAKTKSFEETIPFIAPPLAYAAMMERLREEHGVEIYEDQLPTPAGGKSMML